MTAKVEGGELKTTCAFCLAEVDVHLDVKQRPYWRCWRCEVRAFATRSALRTLEANGWIWSGERPLVALQGWLNRVAGKLRDERRCPSDATTPASKDDGA